MEPPAIYTVTMAVIIIMTMVVAITGSAGWRQWTVADCCYTVSCITGGIAEVMFGLPDQIATVARSYLTDDLILVLDRFLELKRGR